MFGKRALTVLAVIIIVTAVGCSGAGTSVVPRADNQANTTTVASHSSWGLWQFTADPAAQTLDITRLRQGDFHLNALPFLEPPVLVNLTLDNLVFNGNIVEADIGLRHPFLGLDQFTGFDVCGILISNGSVTGFSDANLRMAGDGDTRLLNYDGLSRWWNPAEFPVNPGTMFGYTDGLLGTPDSFADYNSTLNGYKYYCDDLDDITDTLEDITLANRGMFSAGQKNVRHFSIEIGSGGLVFNYAIDASWQFPTGSPPYVAPDDFPAGANRAEAYRINITETENTLWSDGVDSGGSLGLSIDVYDWFGAELNTVRVESPGNFVMTEASTPVDVGDGYATFEIFISDATPAPPNIPLLISVISEEENYEGFISGTNTTAYFTEHALVLTIQPEQTKNLPLRDDAAAVDLAVTPEGDLLILYDDGEVWKYLAADGFLQADATELFTALSVAWPGSPQVLCNYRIDVSQNGNIIAAAWPGSPWPGQSFAPDGTTLGSPPAGGAGDNCYEVYTYPGTGGYSNNHMIIVPGNGGAQNNMYRHVVPSYWAQIYQTPGENEPTGYDKVKFTQIVGAEGVSNNQFWLIEDTPDYYAARWMHTGPSSGNFNFDGAWFGTGTQTEDDTGWCEAKDLTWDEAGRFYVLDKLPSGQGRIKVFEDGSPGTALTDHAAGDSSSISETPLRIEGSPFNSGDFGNLIFVLHGDDIPSKLSLFPPGDFGF